MKFGYREYDPSNESLKDLLKRLKDLYHDLLLQADGDPEQALDWLELLARRYNQFPKGLSIGSSAVSTRTPRATTASRRPASVRSGCPRRGRGRSATRRR